MCNRKHDHQSLLLCKSLYFWKLQSETQRLALISFTVQLKRQNKCQFELPPVTRIPRAFRVATWIVSRPPQRTKSGQNSMMHDRWSPTWPKQRTVRDAYCTRNLERSCASQGELILTGMESWSRRDLALCDPFGLTDPLQTQETLFPRPFACPQGSTTRCFPARLTTGHVDRAIGVLDNQCEKRQ